MSEKDAAKQKMVTKGLLSHISHDISFLLVTVVKPIALTLQHLQRVSITGPKYHTQEFNVCSTYLINDQGGQVLENCRELVDARDNVRNLLLARCNERRVVAKLGFLLLAETL